MEKKILIKKALDYGVAGLFGVVFGIAIQQVKESTIKCSCYGCEIALIIVGISFLISLFYIIYTKFIE